MMYSKNIRNLNNLLRFQAVRNLCEGYYSFQEESI